MASRKNKIVSSVPGIVSNYDEANSKIEGLSVTGITADDISTVDIDVSGTANIPNITVSGEITGNLVGDVTGNVTGDLTGDVTGNVTGDLTGDVTGNVTGDLTGDVTGNVTGDLTGDVTGDLTGDVTGNVTGDLTGNVTGDLTGDVNGNVTIDSLLDVGGVENLIIDGGTDGQVLTTDGTGNISFADTATTLQEVTDNGNTTTNGITVDGGITGNLIGNIDSDTTITGNALVTGDMVINGNITYVNVDSFAVEDPIIELGGGPNGTPLTGNDGKDRGTSLEYYDTSAKTAFMGWDNSNAEFIFGREVTINDDVVTVTEAGNIRLGTIIGDVTGDVTGNVTIDSLLDVGNVENLIIDGGTDGQVLTTDGTGNISFADTATTLQEVTDNGNITTNNIEVNAIVTSDTNTDNTDANTIRLLGGNATGNNSEGGSIDIFGGDGTDEGGDIDIFGGNSSADGSFDGGRVRIRSGFNSNGIGGAVRILSGADGSIGFNANPGYIRIRNENDFNRIDLEGGNGENEPGNINIWSGDGSINIGSENGNTRIGGWTNRSPNVDEDEGLILGESIDIDYELVRTRTVWLGAGFTETNPAANNYTSNTYIFANNTIRIGNTSSNITTETVLIDAEDIVFNGTADLGNVENVVIDGGTDGYVLSTDGSGNLSWVDTATTLQEVTDNGNTTTNSIEVGGSVILGNESALTNTGQGTLFITTPNTTGDDNDAEQITIQGGNAAGANAEGGDIRVRAGAGTGPDGPGGGELAMRSGYAFGATSGDPVTGGRVTIEAPPAYDNDTDFNPVIGTGDGMLFDSAGGLTLRSGRFDGFLTANAVNDIMRLDSVGNLDIIVGGGDNPNANINMAAENSVIITAPNIAFNGTTDLGNVENVVIDGGSDGYVLSTDGSGNLSWIETSSQELEEIIAATNEPTGFPDPERTQTAISFDEGNRQFTIEPTGSSFDVWVQGTKYTKSTSETVTIDDTDGLWYISYDGDGNLQALQTYYDWANVAPVSYVYWDSANSVQHYFADERHGSVMDWATHEYLHRTRGAAIANGFDISGSLDFGGSQDLDAQIGMTGGTFFDEDIEINILGNAVPLSTAILYRSGNIWFKDPETAFPYKRGTARSQYNLNTNGNWSTVDISNGGYGVNYVCATNDVNTPFIVILGQDEYNNVTAAREASFNDLNLDGLPSIEFRVLYKLIFRTGNFYTNQLATAQREFVDLREFFGFGGAGVGGAAGADNSIQVNSGGQLTGYANFQYLDNAFGTNFLTIGAGNNLVGMSINNFDNTGTLLSNQDLFIITGDTDQNIAGNLVIRNSDIQITSSNASYDATITVTPVGSALELITADNNDDGVNVGDIELRAGNSLSGNNTGGDVKLYPGYGVGEFSGGGSVLIRAGEQYEVTDADNADPGRVEIRAYPAYEGNRTDEGNAIRDGQNGGTVEISSAYSMSIGTGRILGDLTSDGGERGTLDVTSIGDMSIGAGDVDAPNGANINMSAKSNINITTNPTTSDDGGNITISTGDTTTGGTGEILLQGANATANNAGSMFLYGGTSNDENNENRSGGAVVIAAGDLDIAQGSTSNGSSGSVTIRAGNVAESGQHGVVRITGSRSTITNNADWQDIDGNGSVLITGGSRPGPLSGSTTGLPKAGTVTLEGGSSTSGLVNGGDVDITGGPGLNSSTAAGGNVSITGGYNTGSTGVPGNVLITGGQWLSGGGSQIGGDVTIRGGFGGGAVSGPVNIEAGDLSLTASSRLSLISDELIANVTSNTTLDLGEATVSASNVSVTSDNFNIDSEVGVVGSLGVTGILGVLGNLLVTGGDQISLESSNLIANITGSSTLELGEATVSASNVSVTSDNFNVTSEVNITGNLDVTQQVLGNGWSIDGVSNANVYISKSTDGDIVLRTQGKGDINTVTTEGNIFIASGNGGGSFGGVSISHNPGVVSRTNVSTDEFDLRIANQSNVFLATGFEIVANGTQGDNQLNVTNSSMDWTYQGPTQNATFDLNSHFYAFEQGNVVNTRTDGTVRVGRAEIIDFGTAGERISTVVANTTAGIDLRVRGGDTLDTGNTGVVAGDLRLEGGYALGNSSIGGNVYIDSGANVNGNGTGDVLIGTQANRGNVAIGQSAGQITFNAPAVNFSTAVYTVANLPGAGNVGVGGRAFVSDSNVTAAGNFGNAVFGGGANGSPVYSDGLNWRIG